MAEIEAVEIEAVEIEAAETEVVGWQGLEPWTNALKGHCSTN